MRKDPKKLSPETQDRLAQEILALKAATEPRAWEREAYFKQLPPDHPKHHLPDPVTGLRCGCEKPNPDWQIWLLRTGRGYGKTRTGANWAIGRGLSEPGIWVAVCAPTFLDVKNVCFEGPTGILNCALPGEIQDYNKNDLRISLRNGSIIKGYTADRVDSIRGANLAYCWFDELGVARYEEFYTFGLMPALRVSKSQLLVTTTPRNSPLLNKIQKDADEHPEKVHFTHAASIENWKSPKVREMRDRIIASVGEGSFLARQELEGEHILDVPGALFQMEWFDRSRMEFSEVPEEFRRVVIGVDPAATANPTKSDETGIIVAGEGEDHHLYTLEDLSFFGSPDKVMNVIVAAYHKWNASLVVVEHNTAGDYFKIMLYNKDPFVSYKSIHAMYSKKIRAQPVSPLAEQGRIHMVGDRSRFEELERQLCAMTSYDDRVKAHDDRGDAWVYAMRELGGFGAVNYKEIYGFSLCLKCGGQVHVYMDKKCKKCGEPVIAATPEKDDVRKKSAVRWAAAYSKTCPKGHEYPAKLDGCPECNGDPAGYMARVGKISGMNSGWLSYTGKSNWTRGRGI